MNRSFFNRCNLLSNLQSFPRRWPTFVNCFCAWHKQCLLSVVWMYQFKATQFYRITISPNNRDKMSISPHRGQFPLRHTIQTRNWNHRLIMRTLHVGEAFFMLRKRKCRAAIDIFVLPLLIVAIKSSFSQLPCYYTLKTLYLNRWLWSDPYNGGRGGRLTRIMFVLSAVMNNNAAFYYIQRKHLFFTRDRQKVVGVEGERLDPELTPNIAKVYLCFAGRKRETRLQLYQENRAL